MIRLLVLSNIPSASALWWEKTTKDGKVYYSDSKTEKTTWDKPEGVEIWSERKDKNGKTYYANSLTKKTQWTRPVDDAAKGATSPVAPAEATPAPAPATPAPEPVPAPAPKTAPEPTAAKKDCPFEWSEWSADPEDAKQEVSTRDISCYKGEGQQNNKRWRTKPVPAAAKAEEKKCNGWSEWASISEADAAEKGYSGITPGQKYQERTRELSCTKVGDTSTGEVRTEPAAEGSEEAAAEAEAKKECTGWSEWASISYADAEKKGYAGLDKDLKYQQRTRALSCTTKDDGNTGEVRTEPAAKVDCPFVWSNWSEDPEDAKKQVSTRDIKCYKGEELEKQNTKRWRSKPVAAKAPSKKATPTKAAEAQAPPTKAAAAKAGKGIPIQPPNKKATHTKSAAPKASAFKVEAAKAETTAPSSGKWKKVYSDEYKKDYYYNTETMEVQWEEPAGFVESSE